MPKFLRRSSCLLIAAAAPVVTALALTGCKNYDVKIADFNPRALQGSERANAQQAAQSITRPLPTTLQSPFADEEAGATTEPGTTRPATTEATTQATNGNGRTPPATGPALGSEEGIIHMSLREIIQRAVANSLDVRVAGYEPAIDETRVTEAEARFDPTFFTNFQYATDHQLAPTPDNPTLGTNEDIIFRSYFAQVGVRQELESGGKVELRYEPRYTHRYPDFAVPDSPNPFWTSNLTLEITQPLLRDFGSDVNRARIVINRNNQKISLLDFRDALEKNVSDIEEAYWNLLDAEREVHIAEELLNRTLATGQILYNRRTQDVGRVQMSQANSSIEQRRTNLIRARAHVRDLSDQIKRLMNDPDMPVTSNTVILPADVPLEEQVKFNLDDQINTAMESRLELGQQQLRAENAAVAAGVAKNNLLPQLNFVGNVSTQGIGGAWGTSFEDSWGGDHIGYSLGVQLEIPIGNRAARAIWKRAQLQRMQAIDQYRALVDQVALDVKQAAREVDTSWEEMAGFRAAVFAAADALAAVEERERANEALTPEFVNRKLDLQQQLAEAQRQEAIAVSKYQVAISKLEKAKGTLLRYNNIIMEEAPLNGAMQASAAVSR